MRGLRGVALSLALLALVGCSGGGTVVAAEGAEPGECDIAVIQLRDAQDRRPDSPYRHVTRSSAAGDFRLPSLPAGLHLLVAVQPVSPSEPIADLDGLLDQIVAGRLPESYLVARELLYTEGDSYRSGVALQLGCRTDDGVRVTGRLGGDFRPDEFEYDIAVTMHSSGASPAPGQGFTFQADASSPGPQPRVVMTQKFQATPAADGSFDLGWLPSSDPAQFSIHARGSSWGETLLVNERVALDQDLTPLDATLPFHTRVTLRVEGATSDSRHGPSIDYWAPEGSAGAHHLNGATSMSVIVREGGYIFRARGDGQASALQAVGTDADRVSREVVLKLEPCASWSTLLLDELRQPLPFGFLRLGTPESLAFDDPYRVFLMPRMNSEAAIEALLPGVYPAELTLNAGMHTEQRLRFELDLTQARAETRARPQR